MKRNRVKVEENSISADYTDRTMTSLEEPYGGFCLEHSRQFIFTEGGALEMKVHRRPLSKVVEWMEKNSPFYSRSTNHKYTCLYKKVN